MVKKLGIILLLCMLVLAFDWKRGYGAASIVDVLDRGNLQFKEASISGWVKAREKCGDEKSMELLAKNICSCLGAGFYPQWVEKENGGKKVIINSPYEAGNLELIIENINNESFEAYTIITIHITHQNNLKNINTIRDRVNKCLSRFGSGPPANLCITAYREGELSDNERHSIIDTILEEYDAVGIKSIERNNLLSIIAYTRYISEFVKSNNSKLNINLACRYSESDNKTYFWIGTPLINEEY